MFKKMIFALLAGASYLGGGLHPANCMEAPAIPEPNVIYADRSAEQAPLVRTAAAERPNMGGGFIEFLFGDGQASSRGTVSAATCLSAAAVISAA